MKAMQKPITGEFPLFGVRLRHCNEGCCTWSYIGYCTYLMSNVQRCEPNGTTWSACLSPFLVNCTAYCHTHFALKTWMGARQQIQNMAELRNVALLGSKQVVMLITQGTHSLPDSSRCNSHRKQPPNSKTSPPCPKIEMVLAQLLSYLLSILWPPHSIPKQFQRACTTFFLEECFKFQLEYSDILRFF